MEMQCFVDKLKDDNTDRISENLPRILTTIKQRLKLFIQRSTRHKRTAATHLLVFMISPEERNKKPYAIPVQCIAYKGLADDKVRSLANIVIKEMAKRNMKVAGTALTVLLVQ